MPPSSKGHHENYTINQPLLMLNMYKGKAMRTWNSWPLQKRQIIGVAMAVSVCLLMYLGASHSSQPQNSKYATVMGMATNYDLAVFKRFVGSLRRSGFEGNIILAVSPVPQPGVEDYLNSQDVTMKRLKLVNCTSDLVKMALKDKKDGKSPNAHQVEVMTCAHPYPDLKVRWGRFALLRDYLKECHDCTGPVLVCDVRDTFFQRDPFGPDAPPVDGLQVFQEHRVMRTTHWLVKAPVEKCKKMKIFDKPMLCSGTTIGTRSAMLQYLEAMVKEMRDWMKKDDCCCNKMNGDDQSIHNYLFYSGKLPFATPQLNRVGLVNTVGAQGTLIHDSKRNLVEETCKIERGKAANMPFTTQEEEKKGNWLGPQYDLTDSEGYLIDFNGERSFIVHQFDRLGRPMTRWLESSSNLIDP